MCLIRLCYVRICDITSGFNGFSCTGNNILNQIMERFVMCDWFGLMSDGLEIVFIGSC